MMSTEPKQHDNRIFMDAIAGVLFLIAAFAYSLIHAASLQMLKTQFMIIPAVFVVAGVYLLYKAIRQDHYRLKQQL